MEVTFWGHSCFMVSSGEDRVLIDPGTFTPRLPTLSPQAVVVTHVHPDHFDREVLARLVEESSSRRIFSTAAVAETLGPAVTVIDADRCDMVGSLRFEFTSGMHAEILENGPRPENLAVRVNDQIFYPGDSFSPPGGDVNLLMLPVSAPWLRISDVEKYLHLVRPKWVVPVHTGVLSDDGLKLTMGLVRSLTRDIRAEFTELLPGERCTVEA
ncbi:MBL fold metallo-hydrolase [Leifsonia sp. NPDC058230]|uniref:MBL fold metallo-hydrolase n=1 Tax=Leifsonia sp. NPDC058230 TaxID=3346391 RepID=UPI0036DD3A49